MTVLQCASSLPNIPPVISFMTSQSSSFTTKEVKKLMTLGWWQLLIRLISFCREGRREGGR